MADLAKLIEKENEKELISLLQSLSQPERRKLAPEIKKLSKFYSESVKTILGTFQIRGSNKKHRMCVMAAFVCYTLTEFEKEPRGHWILEPVLLSKVNDWYYPDWFNDYVNRMAGADNFSPYLHYELVMEFRERRLVQPGKRLVARTLPFVIRESNPKVSNGLNSAFTPEKLLKWPVTIQEHIWCLFEEETPINFITAAPWSATEEEKAVKSWQAVFRKFAEEGIIDRKRLLREALQATNKNFSKPLSAWFIDLFLVLKPSHDELIELQPVLFNVLGSSGGKPVTTVLQIIKKIQTDKQFNDAAFIDNIPILLSSKTKTLVASGLMVLEKMVKRNASCRLAVCKAVTQVFMQSDDELQLRAAKIIDFCRADLDPSFGQELAAFDISLMSSARNLLHDLIDPRDNTATDLAMVQPPAITAESQWASIPPIESFEDFLFLASEAVDNNKSWLIDLLPAGFLKMQHQLKGENIGKLEPALQRALKIMREGLRSHQGWLDHMLAVFLIDAGLHLVKKYPADAGPLRKLFEKHEQSSVNNLFHKWLGRDKIYLEVWEPHFKDKIYKPYRLLLLTALKMLHEEIDCPLLSTPTHEPGWIEPGQLVQRLAAWQQKGIEPDSLDWQIAVSRCLLQDTEQAANLAEKLLSGEKLNLLLFLFGKHAEPQAPILNAAVWTVASATIKEKKGYKEQYAWQISKEEYVRNRYEHAQRKYVDQSGSVKMLRIVPNKPGKEEGEIKQAPGGFFSRIFSRSRPGSKNEPGPGVNDDELLLSNFTHIDARYLGLDHNDVRRLFLLIPNNPEPMLAGIIAYNLKYPNFGAESDERVVTATLLILHETWNNAGNIGHLFLGASMLAANKTVQNIAGEIWLKAVVDNKIDNALLGKVIGQHQSIEFAPMKRLTDLISLQLFRVSAQHNKALQIVLENMMVELPAEPIKGMKKLLEIYTELLVANKSEPDTVIAEKLIKWKKAK